MEHPCHISSLADELLNDILSFLVAWSEEAASRNHHRPTHRGRKLKKPVDDRILQRGERSDLDRFRLVCRRFMRIGTPWKFSRFVLRFSREGFQRLNDLLDMQLACHTKYFTYMVRPFYQGRGWEWFLRNVSADDPSIAEVHISRLADQNTLITTGSDLASLRRALGSFSSLRQMKLLRVQDKAYEDILERIRDLNFEDNVCLDWEAACSRAVEGLGIALLGSNCGSVGFVGPQISPEATLKLLHTPPSTISSVGVRLTYLDVSFDAARDITSIVDGLSGVFRNLFASARNLTAIHIGFPARQPVDIRLESIFHRLKWEGLRSFGIQGWRLDSEEIIDLLRRHHRELRDLRLPYIYLREGSRWRDVLFTLHSEMDHLKHVDLREIDYANHFDAETMNGVEVPGSPPQQPVDANPSDQEATNNEGSHTVQQNNSEVFSHIGPGLEELRALTIDYLGDNGVRVERGQWPLWEAWVISKPRSPNNLGHS